MKITQYKAPEPTQMVTIYGTGTSKHLRKNVAVVADKAMADELVAAGKASYTKIEEKQADVEIEDKRLKVETSIQDKELKVSIKRKRKAS